MKKIAIIITTFNQDELLFKCLNSIKNKTNYKNYKVFLVDDHSKKNIDKTIQKIFPWVNLLINDKNLGFSKANNIGIKKASKEYNPDYFLLLNDDAEIIEKNWLDKMISEGERNKQVGILGCKLIYPDGRIQNAGGYIKKWEITKIVDISKNEIKEVDHVMGAFMLIKKEVINKVGFLDEDYSPFLLEDTEYCLRAKRAGFKVISVGKVKVVHKKGQSIDKLNDPILFIRFKNDILFSKRNLMFKYFLFRIFIYLPLVALFRKKHDEDILHFKNMRVRKGFIMNISYLLMAYLFILSGKRQW